MHRQYVHSCIATKPILQAMHVLSHVQFVAQLLQVHEFERESLRLELSCASDKHSLATARSAAVQLGVQALIYTVSFDFPHAPGDRRRTCAQGPETGGWRLEASQRHRGVAEKLAAAEARRQNPATLPRARC